LLANAGLTQVATQPLNDFNLLNSEIPAVLVAAQKAPYAEPAGHSCTLLLTELQALDAALGPDIERCPDGRPRLAYRPPCGRQCRGDGGRTP
jgi:hypothetical protein